MTCSTAVDTHLRALLNLFTPTRKPVRWEQSRDGRRKTIYDEPRTPWARVLEHDAADRAREDQGYVDEATRTHRDDHRLDQPGPARPRHRRHPGPAQTHQPRPVGGPGAPQRTGHGILGTGDRTHARRRRTRQTVNASIVSRSNYDERTTISRSLSNDEPRHRRHMDTVIALAIMLPRASAVHRPHTRCSVAPHSHR